MKDAWPFSPEELITGKLCRVIQPCSPALSAERERERERERYAYYRPAWQTTSKGLCAIGSADLGQPFDSTAGVWWLAYKEVARPYSLTNVIQPIR